MTNPLLAGRRAVRALAHATGVSTAGLCLLPAAAMPALADGAAWPLPLVAQAPPTTGNPPPAPEPNLVQGTSFDIDVIAKALDIARGQIQPSLGATVYQLQRQTIETQTQGDNAPFNQVLLQAPGVAQDSFGQVHVRGDHANLQFRIDGVQLPEGINVFGQALETRLAGITGARDAASHARDLGIINVASSIPQVIGPSVAALVIITGAGYRGLFAFAGLLALGGAAAFSRVPAERIVFASDMPYGRPVGGLFHTLRVAAYAGLSVAEREAIAGDTMTAILEGRPPAKALPPRIPACCLRTPTGSQDGAPLTSAPPERS